MRAEKAARLTRGELSKEWIALHAAHDTGERYARDSVRTWDKHVEPRLDRVTLGALGVDPGIIVRFDEALQESGLAIIKRPVAADRPRARLEMQARVLRPSWRSPARLGGQPAVRLEQGWSDSRRPPGLDTTGSSQRGCRVSREVQDFWDKRGQLPGFAIAA